MAHITHLHSPFYFNVVRRGRSPAIPFCLGTAKGKTCKGWEDQRQLGAPTKGGHLSHEGYSAHAPLCSPGQGRPWAGWTQWLRCRGTEVLQWPGEMSFQHRGGRITHGTAAQEWSQLVLAHWEPRSTKREIKPLGATAAGSQRGGECSSLDGFSKGIHARAGIPGVAAGSACRSRDTPEERAAGRPAT